MSPRGPVAPRDRSLAPPTAVDAGPLSEPELGREREVRRRMVAAADASGFLRFDRFVDIALYSEPVGFYAHPGTVLGPRGEFYTAAHVSPLFGRALARRILRGRERSGGRGHWTVAEIGAGDGALAASLVPALARAPDAVGIDYVIVERSAPLRREALHRARGSAGDGPVSVRSASSLSALGPFRGAVVANELLDALPFRRLVRRAGGWRELGVRLADEGFAWAEGDAPAPLGPDPLPGAEDGTVAEYGPAAEAVPREVADHLTEGPAILIDYGADERELLTAHPSGTLAAIRRHRAVPEVLAHPGLSDLSAFVNFTRVRRAARSAGLEESAYRPLRESLVDWGIEALIEAEVRAGSGAEHEVRTRLAAKNLLLGFDSFHVLELEARGGLRSAALAGSSAR